MAKPQIQAEPKPPFPKQKLAKPGLNAREGADVAITALPAEDRDAEEKQKAIEAAGRRCLVVEGDLTDARFCQDAIDRTVAELGRLDILVSNAAHQNRKESFEDLTDDEFERTLHTKPAYVFLASDADSSFITGVVLPALGGETIEE